MTFIRTALLVSLVAAAISGCGGNSGGTTVGSPDKQSLSTPAVNGANQYSANANNPQRNAMGESQSTNTAGVNNASKSHQ